MSNNETVNSFFSNLPLTNISSGFFIGLAVGFFLKKSFKIVLFLFGLLIVTLFYLQNQDIINLSNDTLLTGTDRFVALIKSVAIFIKDKLSFLQLSGGAGALAGFLVGLKMG
jgi:uncharacterized membrane protein (Fun14 family)